MTVPQVGITHDVVLYVNNSVSCGVTVKPFTYRVQNAPLFISRLTMGDQTGTDKARWRSFVQSRFDGGAGQYIWSGQTGNNRFAFSEYVDVNVPSDGAFNVAPEAEATRYGVAGLAVEPQTHSAEVPSMHTYYFDMADDKTYELPLVTLSKRPHVFQTRADMVYTNVGSSAWDIGVYSGFSDKLTGVWVVTHTRASSDLQVVVGAMNFSNVVMIPTSNSGIKVYGTTNTDGSGAAGLYWPSYSTWAQNMVAYDDKPWRSWSNKVSYLQPAVNTLDAIWSDEIAVGTGEEPVTKMVEFNGRLYMAKRDGMWVYDAGTVYRVVDCVAELDTYNFKLLLDHNGYLYYNIRHKVFRLSSAGLIEEMIMPFTHGVVLGGAGSSHEVLILQKDMDSSNRVVWILDTETGGVRKWFQLTPHLSLAAGYGRPNLPRWMGSNSGMVWLFPAVRTDAGSYMGTPWWKSVPWVSVNKEQRVGSVDNIQFNRYNAYLQASRLDFGFPELRKLFNRVIVTYDLGHDDSYIEVYYKLNAWSDNDWITFNTTWTKLGQIGPSAADHDASRKALAFPDGTHGYNIILRFLLRPYPDSEIGFIPDISLLGFEVEYAFEPSDLEVVDFVALAIDEVERLDMTKENSGAFVAATLWSLSRSPTTHVIGLPWPTVHTVRGIVNISPPGGFTPAMVYNSLGHLDAEIPVRIDEM